MAKPTWNLKSTWRTCGRSACEESREAAGEQSGIYGPRAAASEIGGAVPLVWSSSDEVCPVSHVSDVEVGQGEGGMSEFNHAVMTEHLAHARDGSATPDDLAAWYIGDVQALLGESATVNDAVRVRLFGQIKILVPNA